MLGVIICVALIILGVYLFCIKQYSFNYMAYEFQRIIFSGFLGMFLIFIGGISLAFTLYLPINGYDEPITKNEVTLNAIYVDDETGEEIYAIKSGNAEYLVSYVDNGNIINETIKCIVIEDNSCKIPVKKVCEYKGKKSIWGLALFASKEENILVIPSRNISK